MYGKGECSEGPSHQRRELGGVHLHLAVHGPRLRYGAQRTSVHRVHTEKREERLAAGVGEQDAKGKSSKHSTSNT
jgi:hypothetical protein